MIKKFKSDLIKYKSYSKKNTIVLILTQQGLWAIFVYRFSNALYQAKLPNFLKRIFLVVCVLWQKAIEILTGISLPYSAQIGSSFYIGHFGNIIVNSNAIIGNNCNISQGVTIGVSGRCNRRGVPSIGNDVYIGANAVVVGKITVGDGVVIGANSFVNQNIEAHTTVLGVPAKKVSDNNSEAYL